MIRVKFLEADDLTELEEVVNRWLAEDGPFIAANVVVNSYYLALNQHGWVAAITFQTLMEAKK